MATTYRIQKVAPKGNSGPAAVGDFLPQFSTDSGTTWNPLFANESQDQEEAYGRIAFAASDSTFVDRLAPTVSTITYP